jgi:hypothetical protein
VRPSPPRLWLIAVVLAAAACSTTHAVRPLGRGNASLGASLGGPLVQVAGVDIASPILTIEGGYGLRDDLDVTANLDLTAAAYGDLHLEPGVAYHPIIRDAGPVPTLTVAGSVHFLSSFSDTLVAPQVTLAGAWRIRRRHLIYLGVQGLLASTAPSRPVVGPLVGGELRVGRYGFTLEAAWMAANYDVGPTAPTWLSPDNRGYLDVLVGVTRYIGEVK